MNTKATLVAEKAAITHTAVIELAPAEPAKVILEMTVEQARVLHLILRKIGGDPMTTRGKADCVKEALRDLGIGYAEAPAEGSIYFQD